jgi:MFS family permease
VAEPASPEAERKNRRGGGRQTTALVRDYLRSLNPQLPRPVWLLQVGGVMNSFGNGVVFPFLAIYLHNVRGFGIATAGIAIAISSVAQLVTGVAIGPIIDRVGARRVLASGLILQAAGFGLLPLVRAPWHAYALLALEGIGSAGFWPSQSTLISKLTPSARLHAAFAQQRVTMNLGVGLGGLAGGLIASVSSPETFTVLFVLDGLTFLAYVLVLSFVTEPAAKPLEGGETAGSYREVLRDRLFLGLWTLNFLFVAAGYALINLLPPFLRDHSHITEREIGFIFFFNTITIVLVQLPMSRWLEGKRRLRALALMPFLWALAWLGVDATGYWLVGTAAFVTAVVCAIAFGVGECLHGPAHQALVGELGGDRLRGRYFALHSMSWGLGGAAGPAVGGLILAAAPFALWPLAAAVCLVASAGALALDRRVPPQLARIPRAGQPATGLVHGEAEPAEVGA